MFCQYVKSELNAVSLENRQLIYTSMKGSVKDVFEVRFCHLSGHTIGKYLVK